jgi:hypothetical protein
MSTVQYWGGKAIASHVVSVSSNLSIRSAAAAVGRCDQKCASALLRCFTEDRARSERAGSVRYEGMRMGGVPEREVGSGSKASL